MDDTGTRPWRDVPPGSSPLRELAHAVAGALTLPKDVTELDELGYLRASRNHARVVLFAMRRIIADREIENDERDVMAIVASLRDSTSQLADGETDDPVRAFIEAIIGALAISPAPPTTERAYLQSARQQARRVLLACRRATANPATDDHHLAAAVNMLGQDGGDEDQADAADPELVS